MYVKAETKTNIRKKLPIEVVKVLDSCGISALDIHRIVQKELENQTLTTEDLSLIIPEVEKLINSIKPRKASKYYEDIRAHKTEFLRLLAKGLLDKHFEYEDLERELRLFWTKEYSLVNIFSGLGYNDREVLLKFIGIQNDGMLSITREMKFITEFLKWKKEGKFQFITDVEDCYYWCQNNFQTAAKSFAVVSKWLSSFLEKAKRIDDRLSSELISTTEVEEIPYFLQ